MKKGTRVHHNANGKGTVQKIQTDARNLGLKGTAALVRFDATGAELWHPVGALEVLDYG